MFRKISVIAAAFILALALSAPAVGASPCKGLTKGRCTAKASCSWVDSYKTKNGTRVKGYCRSKPGKGSSATSGSKAKKVSTKGKDAKKKKAATSSSAKKKVKKKSAKEKKARKEKKK
ncbi:MAG TPA: chromosome partitioning protein ParB [Gammaproteobacteria bacterium]|nr:chromosome partitioning protein ParB [Gammaproteobacteria bacterium]